MGQAQARQHDHLHFTRPASCWDRRRSVATLGSDKMASFSSNFSDVVDLANDQLPFGRTASLFAADSDMALSFAR